MALTLSGGVGPFGFGLASGRSHYWATTGGIPFGWTSFWTAMPVPGSTPTPSLTVTVSHNLDAVGIQWLIQVHNSGNTTANYALVWVSGQVSEPVEWPLGHGPFSAGFQIVGDIPISDSVNFDEAHLGGFVFRRPPQNAAIIFYPATEDGQGTPIATGGPFPFIVFGHAKRFPGLTVCPGAPTDTTQDFRQYTGVLSHLARWGFLSIAPDLSWLTLDASVENRHYLLWDALTYVLKLDASSPFFGGKIRTTRPGVMGHSFGGLAAISLATRSFVSFGALALIAPASSAQALNWLGWFTNPFSVEPLLVLHGTRDGLEFGVDEDPLRIYDAANRVKHLVQIGGANHFGYTDSICLQPTGDSVAAISQPEQQTIAVAYLTAFFRRYLLDQREEDNYLSGARGIEGLDIFDIQVQYKP